MEFLFTAVMTLMTAQLGVLAGIFFRIGGMSESMRALKERVTNLEKLERKIYDEEIKGKI